MGAVLADAFNPLHYPMAFQNPKRITEASAWVTHIPFAMTLMQMLRPGVFVELGTLKGDSYCAFCQAVAELKLRTRCFAVDTWQGDVHVGELAEDMLTELAAYHDPQYGGFSTLVQSDFDSAVSRFEDGSIDLLHIDGCHTYEAVTHDYQTWKPKLSRGAVVLFHDTDVRKGDFGVWKFWAEVSKTGPSFEFKHGHGLGVLGSGAEIPEEFARFIRLANAAPDLVRQFYFCVGHRIELFRTASSMMEGLNRTLGIAQEWQRQVGQSAGGGASLISPLEAPHRFAKSVVDQVQKLADDDLAVRRALTSATGQ